MKSWIQYSLINTILGTLFGFYILYTSIDSDKFLIFTTTVLSSFLVSAIVWKIVIKVDNELKNNKIIVLGFLVGTVSHYSTFFLWGIIRLVCYLTTGNCTSSMGSPPDLFGVFIASFLLAFFTIIFYGWITVPLAILGGYFTKLLIDKRA